MIYSAARPLFLLTPHMRLRRERQQLIIEQDGAEKSRLPVHLVNAVIAEQTVRIGGRTMQILAHEGIDLTFVSRGGRPIARLESLLPRHLNLRRAQYRAADDPAFCLVIARTCVDGKLRGCRERLQRAAREAGEPATAARLRAASGELSAILKLLPRCLDLGQLRGREGWGADVYFRTFPDLFSAGCDPIFAWVRRSRRPPADPFNALLGFSYALLTGLCQGALTATGLDPSLGFYHEVRPRRPALALDLMEEFRPRLADRLAFALVNRRQLTADDFEPGPSGGIYLKPESRKTVVKTWHAMLQETLVTAPGLDPLPWSRLPHIQARRLAAALRGKRTEFRPFFSSAVVPALPKGDNNGA